MNKTISFTLAVEITVETNHYPADWTPLEMVQADLETDPATFLMDMDEIKIMTAEYKQAQEVTADEHSQMG